MNDLKNIIRNFLLILFCLLISITSYSQDKAFSIPVKETKIETKISIWEFIENKGQFVYPDNKQASDIKYIAKKGNLSLYIKEDGFSYVITKNKKANPFINQNIQTDSFTVSEKIDIEFRNNKESCVITGEDKVRDYINYYLPQCPDGILNVRKYRKIIYKELYENIDLVFYTNPDGELQFDFIVNPGGDPSNIALSVKNNPHKVQINNNSLIIKSSLSEIVHTKPYSYQKINGIESEVPSTFYFKDNLIKFNNPDYDKDYKLIIDPVVRMWGTFFGGNQNDFFNSAKYDSDNNIIACGSTGSNKLATEKAYQNERNNSMDGVIIKMNSSGDLIWSTYYGGSSMDYIGDLAIDNSNNIYLLGSSTSNDVLGNEGFQDYNKGNYDSFIARFDSNGYRVWGTFYGGLGADNPFNDANRITNGSIKIDSDGNLVIVAYTRSDSLVSKNCWQCCRGGLEDLFIVKLNQNGELLWDTYYGGELFDRQGGTFIDKKNNIYISGWTESDNYMAAEGAFQENIAAYNDGFIVKFDKDGNRLCGTYLGGNGYDNLLNLVIDNNNNIYTIGSSSSSDQGSGKWRGTYTANHDMILYKITGDLKKKIWATYYGGENNDFFYDIILVNDTIIYVTGNSWSDETIVKGGFQTTRNGRRDPVIAKYNTSGKQIWSTFYGGSSGDDQVYNDNIFTLDINDKKEILICGYTNSTDIFGEGGFQSEYGGGLDDGWIAVLKDYDLVTNKTEPSSVCAGKTISIPFTLNEPLEKEWEFEALLSDSSGSFENPIVIGSINSKNSDTIVAVIPGDIPPGKNYLISIIGSYNEQPVTINQTPVSDFNGPVYVCSQKPQTYESEQNNDLAYKWSLKYGTINTADNLTAISCSWSEACIDTISLTVINRNTGCQNVKDLVVYIDKWNSEIIGKRLICEGKQKQDYISNIQGVLKKWIAYGGQIISEDNKDTVTVLWNNSGNTSLSLILTSKSGGCCDTTTIKIVIDDSPAPTPEITGKVAVCDNDYEDYYTTFNSKNKYKWMITGGNIIGSDTNNLVKVKWSSNTEGWLSVTEITPAGCSTYTKKRIYINSYGLEIQGEFEICKSGTYNYSVEKIPETSNYWSVINGQILNDPESDTVKVKWAESGMKILNIKRTTFCDSGSCNRTISKFIEEVQKEAVLSIPEITFDPKEQYDQILNIPVFIKEPGCLFYEEKSDSITAYIRLRKSLYLPVKNDGQQYSDHGIWRTIILKTPANYSKTGDTIALIKGYGLLGDTLETPVYIDSLLWSNSDIRSSYKNGKLKLTGIPDAGGLRLLKQKSIKVLLLYPVPATNYINITIESENKSEVKAEVFNYLGELVYSKYINLKPGVLEEKIQFNNGLPVGVYNIVISDKDNIISKNIMIR